MSTLVIGTTGDAGSDDATALGIALAVAWDAQPVVAHVRPEPWQAAGAGRVDAEWDAYLDERSRVIVEEATASHASDFAALHVTAAIGRHRSSGAGLDAIAVEHGAEAIVIGSAPGGKPGRIQGGSTSEHLMHGASVPVVIAPSGYAARAPERITRIVVAIETTEHHAQLEELVTSSRRRGVDVAFVTIVRRATRIYGSKLGREAESLVMEALREEAAASLTAALAAVGDDIPGHVLVGDDVTAALAGFGWHDGDLLACGSSRVGPLRRVLLGDMTFRILRGATVPVLVAPRR